MEIVCGDVLQTDLGSLIRTQQEAHGLTGSVHILGNLPYYITTPILMALLEADLPVQTITVMMQKEVADRIEAGPGSRAYGAISVAVQYHCEVSRIIDVPKEMFLPAPKVDSTVLLLEVRDAKAVQVADEKTFFECVKAGFGQRRKTLGNALSGAGRIPKEMVRDVLAAADIDSGRRAETLSLEEFARIANELTAREQTAKEQTAKEQTAKDFAEAE